MQKIPLTGVLLAGGKNSRMGGREKAFLPIDGSPLVERTLSVLQSLFAETLIVTNSPSSYIDISAPTTGDLFPNCGPLGGLHAALSHITTGGAFIVACDMPFLNGELIRWLLGQWGDEDALVAVVADRIEPLHAIYARKCLSTAEACLNADRLAIQDFLDTVHVRYVPENEFSHIENATLSFHNVNTPNEFNALSELSQEGNVH